MKKESASTVTEHLKNSTGRKQAFLIKKHSNDDRLLVKNEIKRLLGQRKAKQRLKNHFKKLSGLEKSFLDKGFDLIAGVDEAGRGPLAGPIVAASVILKPLCYIEGLKDCKLLLPEQRELIYIEVLKNAVSYSIFEVSPFEIDEAGLHKANLKALNCAVTGLDKKPDFVLSDGFKIQVPYPNLKVIKGDNVSISIAAASVVAKVHRDRLMDGYHAVFPQYGFNQNKGYGTESHMEALKRFGPCPIHRHTFEPVRANSAEEPKL